MVLASGFFGIFTRGDIGIAGYVPLLAYTWLRGSRRATWLGGLLVLIAVAGTMENLGLWWDQAGRIVLATSGLAVAILALLQHLFETYGSEPGRQQNRTVN